MKTTRLAPTRRDLDTVSPRAYKTRLLLARLLASKSNDLPGWRGLRRALLQRLLMAPRLSIGSQVRLDRSHPELGGRLVVGANVDIGSRVILDTCGGLRLEDGCALSMDALILTHDHVIADAARPWREQEKVPRPVTIEADTWVGARAVVLGSARRIAHGSIVGASSVVTRPTPEFGVLVGNPAKVLHYREPRPADDRPKSGQTDG